MHRFAEGDIVRIRPSQEIKNEGHAMTDHCAIVCYEGSTAEVMSPILEDQYLLSPINVETSFDPKKEGVYDMSYYGWHDWTLEQYKEESNASTGFDLVFD